MKLFSERYHGTINSLKWGHILLEPLFLLIKALRLFELSAELLKYWNLMLFCHCHCVTRINFKRKMVQWYHCSILLLSLDKQRRKRIYKDKILYYAYMEHGSSQRKFAREQAVRSRNGRRKLTFRQNSRPYIVLNLPHDIHSHASSSILCFFTIVHVLNPHIFYVSGITHTHFYFSSSHFDDFIYDWIYIST